MLYFNCLLDEAVTVLRLFLKVPWVGLQCVIVTFPGHMVIKLFSCTTQLSIKMIILIMAKMLKNEDCSCFKSPRCCIYHANNC